MLDITEELKNYIDSVSVNLYYYFILFNEIRHIEEYRMLADLETEIAIDNARSQTEYIDIKRRETIKIAIIALIKIYKNIPLTDEESLILNRYSLENTSDDLENKIACIVYKISSEAREKVNKIRLGMDIRKDGVFKTLPSAMFLDYLNCLDEYNEQMLHAWICKHKFFTHNPINREMYSPSFDFNSDCFVEVKSYKKLLLFFNRLRKK